MQQNVRGEPLELTPLNMLLKLTLPQYMQTNMPVGQQHPFPPTTTTETKPKPKTKHYKMPTVRWGKLCRPHPQRETNLMLKVMAKKIV
jgi:hypothetical protein